MGCKGSSDRKNKQKNEDMYNRMDSVSNMRSFYKNDRFSKCPSLSKLNSLS